VRPRSQRPRLYDGFMFFNELDILEVRLAELYPVVERFVLVESNSTHSNNHKPLHYEENKERFAAYADKIIHVVVEDTPTDEGVAGSTDEHWKREKFQRDAIVRGLATVSMQRDDIVLISDVDEIPRRDAALSLLTCDIRTKVFPIEMRTYMYYYDLNWMWFHGAPGEEVPKYWTYGPKAVYRHQLDTITPSVFRTYHPATHSQTIYPKCAGWHFSYFGGVKRIQAKLQAYAHQVRSNRLSHTESV
jgi:beta-1,4-mannosyl-glycoprotein beta-1,4-N-acetylglucosaminyltransferase